MNNQYSVLRRARHQFGLSIVELLIGIALGLFVLAGATMVASNQVADNKRLLLETQVQQDMRTAMDVIVRDARRSGFSYKSNELQKIGASAETQTNKGHKPAGIMDTTNALIYTYAHTDQEEDDGGTADTNNFKGFRLEGSVIKVQLGLENWQALTDPDVVEITKFEATPVKSTDINLPTCDTPAACDSVGPCGGSQRIVPRYIDIKMEGNARHDTTVVRRLVTRVKVRNDEVCL